MNATLSQPQVPGNRIQARRVIVALYEAGDISRERAQQLWQDALARDPYHQSRQERKTQEQDKTRSWARKSPLGRALAWLGGAEVPSDWRYASRTQRRQLTAEARA